MQQQGFFTEHYEGLLIATYIALMALVIFFMNLHTIFQIVLLIASGLVLGWMLHQHRTDEPPCGGDIGAESIGRPRPGYNPPGFHGEEHSEEKR